MTDKPGPADHAEDFARRYTRELDQYCALRMEELGIPEDTLGAEDPYHRTPWRAFVAEERSGGHITTGITVNSGVLNPELLKGGKGERLWPRARLRDRIDAIIAHEWEEHHHGTHEAALKASPKTELPITDGARRIPRALRADPAQQITQPHPHLRDAVEGFPATGEVVPGHQQPLASQLAACLLIGIGYGDVALIFPKQSKGGFRDHGDSLPRASYPIGAGRGRGASP